MRSPLPISLIYLIFCMLKIGPKKWLYIRIFFVAPFSWKICFMWLKSGCDPPKKDIRLIKNVRSLTNPPISLANCLPLIPLLPLSFLFLTKIKCPFSCWNESCTHRYLTTYFNDPAGPRGLKKKRKKTEVWTPGPPVSVIGGSRTPDENWRKKAICFIIAW